jgi:DNA-binding protein HU-beta
VHDVRLWVDLRGWIVITCGFFGEIQAIGQSGPMGCLFAWDQPFISIGVVSLDVCFQTCPQHGGSTMNKSDLIEAVASELESSKSEAGKVIEAVINAISDGLKTEEKVAISGFGTFTKKHRAARVGMNPATKQPIQIAESTTCSFKPSQHLKDDLHHQNGQLVSSSG